MPERMVYRLSDLFQTEMEEPVRKAVDECIAHKTEAIEVSIFEYNEEQHLKTVRREDYDNGYDKGYDSGAEETVIKNIKNIMKNAGVSVDKAMELLEVPEEKREAVRGRV